MTTQCAWCKKYKVGDGWVDEAPIGKSGITHGICPACCDEVRKKYGVNLVKPMVGGDVAHTKDGGIVVQNQVITSNGTVQETAIVATETPYYVDEAITRYNREGDEGIDYQFFHVMTDGDRAEFDDWLVRTNAPLASQAGTIKQRFKTKVRQMAKQVQEKLVKESKIDEILDYYLVGLSKGHKYEEFDKNELEMGVKVEQEHVLNAKELSQEEKDVIARTIAMDHLSEEGPGFKHYYTWLEWIEKQMKKKELPE